MKKSVINEMTQAELRREEDKLREELFRLRFQHHTGQLQSPIKLRTTRRSLARVLTRLRAIDLGIDHHSEAK
jgi:large subunit ribosomal protein L29